MGVKGFETLLDTHPLIELDSSLKRAFGKLKQLLKISNEVFKAKHWHFICWNKEMNNHNLFLEQNAIYSARKPLEIILNDLVLQFEQKCVSF